MMFISVTASPPTGGQVTDANANQELVLDLTDPSSPVQKPSITVGDNSGSRGHALSGGEGRFLFVSNNLSRTVTVVDTTTLGVLKSVTVRDNPKQLASWSEVAGASVQSGPF